MRVLRGHRDELRAVAYSPDGRTLATAGKDGMVKLWELPSGKERATLPAAEGWRRYIRRLAFSPDGTLLAAAGGYVSVWKLQTLALLARLDLPPHSVNTVAFGADSKSLAVGESFSINPLQATALHFWEVDAGRWRQLPGGGVQGPISALAFLPGREVLAAGHQKLLPGHSQPAAFQNCVVFWEASTLNELRTLPHEAYVQAVAFSPDGRMLATAAGKAVQLYDVTTGERRAILRGHAKQVNTLAFTPDGRLLSGGNDETVRLWDVASGTQRAAYDWQLRNVRGVAVAPDGMTAAVVGDRRKVVFWDFDA
jgi:WD40 repeat protein